ncbi:putative mediator of RNA polymerase II transcription subunit 15 [Drosophila busckii]|uniref:putative mediator of RNA polymerase II transcription subunit 15 n=1 Tax=Drosophila busckii TaxID=30019 RepID=UPI00083ECCF2|nr:putative mediator of RNA polymerase II transcription subunit 15 [Drosophila busckii]
MERNNGRYAYIRRQGSGGNGPHNHHHHHNNSNSSAASSNASHSSQYSNNSINNAATTNNSSLYASAVSQQNQPQQQQQHQNLPISQHDELILYIREAWNKVNEQGTPVIYCNESDNQLKNFKPFNLEEYWGQRLVQNIHVTTTHQ